MDLSQKLALGWHLAWSFQNLLYACLGAFAGVLCAVLPGIGPIAAIALLLPTLHPLGAVPLLVMLIAVQIGAQYGAGVVGVLVDARGGLPGGADGHAMARRGHAGKALVVAAVGAFVAGIAGSLTVAVLATPIAALSADFGAAEYVALIVFGLLGAVALSAGSLVKSVAMLVVGLLLAQIGTDITSRTIRFGLDLPELGGGISFVPMAIGLFVLGPIVARLGRVAPARDVFMAVPNGLRPTRRDMQDAWPAVLRGTALGSMLGLLPGGGAQLAARMAFDVESMPPFKPGHVAFGKGNIRGLAAPRSAKNAGVQASVTSLLTLGIPTNAVLAMLFAAMLGKGIAPGPQVLTSHAELFWPLVASMWVCNAVLLLSNVALAGWPRLWAMVLATPYRWVFPVLVLVACTGIRALGSDPFDMYLAAAAGVAGYIFHKLDCELAPLVLGFVLGPSLEQNLRGALTASQGDWSVFVTRPVSAGILGAAALTVVMTMLPSMTKRRNAVFLPD